MDDNENTLFVYETRTSKEGINRLVKEEVYWSSWDNCYMTIDVEVVSVGDDLEALEKIVKEKNSKLPDDVKKQMGIK